MFKILLLQPPIKDYYFTPARMEPLGLFYLHLTLSKIKDVEIQVYDATLSGRVKPIQRPEAFSYLDPIYAPDTSPLALPQLFKRLGDSYPKVFETINTFGPDLLVISSNFTAYHPDVEELLQYINERLPALNTVTGGWAIEAEPPYWAARTASKYLLFGPSVLESLEDLVRCLINGNDTLSVPGLIRCSTGNPEWGPPPVAKPKILEEAPIRTGNYYFAHQRSARMILSRGCVHTCGFCAVHRVQSFQVRSLGSIEAELESLAKNGIQSVNFEDDNLFFRPSWSRDFLAILRKFHNEQGMTWTAMNGITASNLAPFVSQALEAGFTEFNLSLVSGDQGALDRAGRIQNRQWIKSIADQTGGRIRTLVFLIGGLPGSTPTGLLEDIQFLCGLPVTIGYSPLYLLPGVPYLESLGLPDDRRLCRTTALYKFPEPFDRDTVLSFWKLVRGLGTLRNQDIDETTRSNLKSLITEQVTQGYWERRDKEGQWHRSTAIKGFRVANMKGIW